MSDQLTYILKNKFKTNRSYGIDFSKIPNSSGVYIIVNRILTDKVEFELLYIGSSINLKSRITSHEVYRILSQIYGDVIFYFREEKEYLKLEKRLISKFKPRFNKQWL